MILNRPATTRVAPLPPEGDFPMYSAGQTSYGVWVRRRDALDRAIKHLADSNTAADAYRLVEIARVFDQFLAEG